MMAPLLPGISDHEENIAAVAEAAHSHGARFLGSNVLFLKPGSKEWFMPMLRETYRTSSRRMPSCTAKPTPPRNTPKAYWPLWTGRDAGGACTGGSATLLPSPCVASCR